MPWIPETSSTGAAVSDLHSIEIAAEAVVWTASPHGNPQAVWDPETERTWIVFFVEDATGPDLYATYYDHTTGDIATPQMVASHPWSAADFHNVPAAMLDGDGRLHVIWGDHGDEGHRHYRMTNPRDLTAWTAQTLATGTYPFAAVGDDGELFFTDRAGGSHGSSFPAHEYGSLFRSTNGTSWTRSTIVDTTGTSESESDFYQQDILFADGHLHIAWCVARGSGHDDARQDVFYARMAPATGVWYAADGTNLGTTITWAEHTTCKVATLSGGSNGAVRISLDWHHGNPVLAYGVDTSSVLTVAEWDGSAWTTTALEVVDYTGRVPRVLSTPDELVLLAHEATTFDVHEYRRVDGAWVDAGVLLYGEATTNHLAITPVRGNGPAVALTVDAVWASTGGEDNVGPLKLITRRHQPRNAATDDHTHDYAEGDHTHASGGGELLMQDGVTAPPVPLETEDRADWIYQG